jgi:hypothetical protein
MAPHHETFMKNKGIFVDCQMLGSVGDHKPMVSRCTNFSCTQMGHGVSRPHKML